jgi:hypothetical protein
LRTLKSAQTRDEVESHKPTYEKNKYKFQTQISECKGKKLDALTKFEGKSKKSKKSKKLKITVTMTMAMNCD